jgi:tetratricopeptide (TPR) repeat protein
LSKVFISYRREDSAAYAGRLCDHLTLLLGESSVFMDVEDLRPGQNFAQTIDRWIGDCNAALVVIGPNWLDCLQRRLKENEQDYVVHEIEAALARKITVIPVLVGGARADEIAGLPPALAELSFRQAVELRDPTFKEDCDRLAKSLGAPERPRSSFKNVRIWAGSLAALMLLLLILNWAGIGPWHAYRERSAHIQQLLRTAQAQTNFGEYEPAFKTYQEILHLDSTNRAAARMQVDSAMLWSEHFHALVGENQKAEDVAGPPLAEILSVLYAGLGRTNGHDARAADILAHLGWTHWLNEHIASKEFGQAAEQGMRQALDIEPTNVYANAMLGNWLLQKNQDFSDAIRHFAVAAKTGKQRPFVRELQLAGLLSTDDAGARAELTKAANQMRLSQEPLTDFYRTRLLRNYNPTSGFRNGELEQTLSAVPSADSWATFLWLDKKPGNGDDLTRGIVRACLAGIDGKRAEALTQFKALRSELKKRKYVGSVADEVDFFIQRLGSK